MWRLNRWPFWRSPARYGNVSQRGGPRIADSHCQFISADFTIARGLNSTMAGGTDRAGSSREAGPSSRNQSTHGTHRATVGAVTKSKCWRPKAKVDFIITTFFLLLRSTLRSARKLAASQISMASLVSLSAPASPNDFPDPGHCPSQGLRKSLK